jgi:hypothetical protein
MSVGVTPELKSSLPDPQCTQLGGVVNAAGECVVNSAATASGSISLARPLHLGGSGSIAVPKASGGATLSIKIAGGLILDGGGKIVGDAGTPNDSAADAGDITLEATGDVVLRGGSALRSDQTAGSCNGGTAGDITLTSTAGSVTSRRTPTRSSADPATIARPARSRSPRRTVKSLSAAGLSPAAD